MKNLILMLSLTISLNSFADQTQKLVCDANVFEISTIRITENLNDLSKMMDVLIKDTQGDLQVSQISAEQFNKLGQEEIFLKIDGGLRVFLLKKPMAEGSVYYLNLRGDGVNTSSVINCSN
jgi:hypothetical protein